MSAKEVCPHCQSPHLSNVPFLEVVQQLASELSNPIGLFSLTRKLAKREITRFGALFRPSQKYADNATAKRCKSCQAHSIQCSLCKKVFKLAKYELEMVITCPHCSATLGCVS